MFRDQIYKPSMTCTSKEFTGTTSVVDPHHDDADPDTTFHLDADPDPDPSF
jgi:hypothetical protein